MRIKFGGPNFPPGVRSWFEARHPLKTGHVEVRPVQYGDEVEDSEMFYPGPQYFIAIGMASVVVVKA